MTLKAEELLEGILEVFFRKRCGSLTLKGVTGDRSNLPVVHQGSYAVPQQRVGGQTVERSARNGIPKTGPTGFRVTSTLRATIVM